MSECPRTREEAAWYANDTLPRAARREFEAHLADCPDCRWAVAFDARLSRAMDGGAARVLPAPQLAWRRLETQLDGENPVGAATPAAGPSARRRHAMGSRRVMQFAIAAQAAAILVLVVALWAALGPDEVQDFRTLGSGDATLASPAPLLRVAFQPGHPDASARRIIAGAGGELRDRLDGTSAYTVEIPVRPGEDRASKVAGVLDELRRHPAVIMAEPVTDELEPAGGR
jgi:hypothetical protein